MAQLTKCGEIGEELISTSVLSITLYTHQVRQ